MCTWGTGCIWSLLETSPKGLYIHKNGESVRAQTWYLAQWTLSIKFQSTHWDPRLRNNGTKARTKHPNLTRWRLYNLRHLRNHRPLLGRQLLEEEIQNTFPDKQIDVINAGVPVKIYWGSIARLEQTSTHLRTRLHRSLPWPQRSATSRSTSSPKTHP